MSRQMRLASLALASLTAFAVTTVPVSAYVFWLDQGIQLRWPTSRSVVLSLELGSTAFEPMRDGSTTFNQVGAAAAATWNRLADVNLVVVEGSDPSRSRGNDVNNVFFERGSFYGQSSGDALAITLHSYDASNGVILETDVVFDSSRAWNSYRGDLQPYSGGGTLYDLRRVAIHEFGHLLGLDHPDGAGQSVSSIMNSRAGNVDTVQADDINGLQAIYGRYMAAPDRLIAGSTMRGGQWLTSLNGRYRLYMQGDSNLVLYDMSRGGSPGEALWSTGASAANGQAIFQSDGNFVVYDGGMNPIYFTSTEGNPGAFMVLQNDGNLVIYSADGRALWMRSQ